MSLIDQPVPNLFGGVSQQPALSRFSNQLELQENSVADPVLGLAKRPPTEHIKKLMGTSADRPATFIIKRDETSRYLAVISGGVVKVFDLVTGTEKTVTNNAPVYLDTVADPAVSLRALTVADYTFIMNREITVSKKASTKSPSRPYEALIFVRAGNYGRAYSIDVREPSGTGLGAGFRQTPDGSTAAMTSDIDTQAIATHLASTLTTTLSGKGFTITQYGSLIYLSRATDFKLTAEDGQGRNALRVYKGEVQRFTDLPDAGVDGFTIQVTGDPSTTYDNHWVRYNGSTWEETIAPLSDLALDPATMPVALVRNPDDTFEVIELPLVDRKVGDDESNPFPSFTGLPLRGMFLFKNRLGFLADENVILSKTGDYFNFFRTTVTELLDDDPIDVVVEDASGDGSEVSLLENAVAFDNSLVLFARNAQYSLQSEGPLTPTSASIIPVTAYETSSACRPVGAGKFVYFVFNREGASGVREMNSETVTRRKDAPDATAHVPAYLPGNIRYLASSSLESLLVAVPQSGNALYAYDYLWSNDGSEKLQASWGKWTFHADDDIVSFNFVDNVGYLVIKRADGYHLERMRFTPNLKDTGLSYFTHLDRRAAGTKSYSAVTGLTTITLPWQVPAEVQVVTGYSATSLHAPGKIIPVVSRSGYTLTISGDKTAWSLVVGIPYTQRFSPTRPIYMAQSSSGTVANTEANLKVRDYSLDYSGTGYFTATFSPRYRGEYTKTFTGLILGATPTDIPTLDDGTFRLKTQCDTLYWQLLVENDSPFPSRFLAASWRGVIASRSQRV